MMWWSFQPFFLCLATEMVPWRITPKTTVLRDNLLSPSLLSFLLSFTFTEFNISTSGFTFSFLYKLLSFSFSILFKLFCTTFLSITKFSISLLSSWFSLLILIFSLDILLLYSLSINNPWMIESTGFSLHEVKNKNIKMKNYDWVWSQNENENENKNKKKE